MTVKTLKKARPKPVEPAAKSVEQTMTEIAAAIGRRIRASAKITEQGA